MKYTDLKNYYLCGIGAFHGIESFHVARYDKERDCFYFSNGDLGSIEQFVLKKHRKTCEKSSAIYDSWYKRFYPAPTKTDKQV